MCTSGATPLSYSDYESVRKSSFPRNFYRFIFFEKFPKDFTLHLRHVEVGEATFLTMN